MQRYVVQDVPVAVPPASQPAAKTDTVTKRNNVSVF